jgi:hypothetical protein
MQLFDARWEGRLSEGIGRGLDPPAEDGTLEFIPQTDGQHFSVDNPCRFLINNYFKSLLKTQPRHVNPNSLPQSSTAHRDLRLENKRGGDDE